MCWAAVTHGVVTRTWSRQERLARRHGLRTAGAGNHPAMRGRMPTGATRRLGRNIDDE